MASHNRIPWDMPIVLGRSVCRKCGLTVSGKVCGDKNGYFQGTMYGEASDDLFATCAKGHDDSKSRGYDTPHDFVGATTTLKELFPYPSLYARMSSIDAHKFGEDYFRTMAPSHSTRDKDDKDRSKSDATVGSYRQERFDLTMLANIMEGDDEDASNENVSKSGSGLDESITSNRSSINTSRHSLVKVKSSMTHSLKTTSE